MVFMLIVAVAVTSVAAMKHVQQRTKKQQNVRQGSKNMRPMFFPEKKASDGGKAEKDQAAS